MPDPSFLKISLTGLVWASREAFFLLEKGCIVRVDTLKPYMIPAEKFTDRPLCRYGRFDHYTRLGFASAGLAIKSAGILLRPDTKANIGILTSSADGSLQTDLEFYRSSIEDAGALASPNLFSYTLPAIVNGECALHFMLGGPTFFISDSKPFSIEPLLASAILLASASAEIMIAGSIESPEAELECGGLRCSAVFAVLSKNPFLSEKHLYYDPAGRTIYDASSRKIGTMLDLIGGLL